MGSLSGGTAKAFRRPGTLCLILAASLLSACAEDGQRLALKEEQRCSLPASYAAMLRTMPPKRRDAYEPLAPLSLAYPDTAAFKQAEGCALVRFTVAADGTAQHVTVIAEYPAGSGFGAALARAVSQARYRRLGSKPRYQHTDFLMAGQLGK